MTRTIFHGCGAVAGTLAVLALRPADARAQATSRPCIGRAGGTPGPARLLAYENLGPLPPGPLYRSLFSFPDFTTAKRVRPPQGAVRQAFGRVWRFDIGDKIRKLGGGRPTQSSNGQAFGGGAA